jgi:CDP-glucose 4,6-dehydratase
VPDSGLVRSGLAERLTVVRGDVIDSALIERVLSEYAVETVFHLAAQTIVSTALASPVATFEANVAGTWTVLDACRRSTSVGQIVLASSDKAYGEQEDLPYREDSPLQGRHPYDTSKACADLIAQAYARAFDLPVAITRYANLFGGGDLHWSRVVPGTIRSLVRGEPPVIRSDGRYVRDYLYVEDAVAAYMLVAERLAERPDLAGEAFNFSNEQPLTVLELVQRITALAGSTVHPVVLDEAMHEIRCQYLSAEKAREVLGWRPRFALEEGLRRTIEWYRSFLSAAPPES